MSKVKAKAAEQKVAKKVSGVNKADINEEIKKKAYFNFENSGRVNGNDLVHWYEAEIEVLAGIK